MVLFLSKEFLDRNIFSMLPTQLIPDFFVAEYHGLRNTIFGGPDFASVSTVHTLQRKNYSIENFWHIVTGLGKNLKNPGVNLIIKFTYVTLYLIFEISKLNIAGVGEVVEGDIGAAFHLKIFLCYTV
jgi:hypothetical protein